MSKMPAKKKSCFQITSVTQAQVGASSVTDDTESLDDPDESRSEDASSEILFDATRSDYEPVCDRGSPEEALINIAADTESPFGQLSNNPTGVYRKLGVAGSHSGQHMPGAASSLSLVAQPGAMTQQVAPAPTSLAVNVSQPAQGTTSAPSSTTTTTTTASTVSCSSRFRVIKLDHGSGEPFRRGRWTCTEFYEKDSEGSVANRTADSIRHATAPSDLNTDRDSGLGHTGGSGVAPAAHSGQGSGSVDASLSASPSALSMQPVEQQIHHQTYGTVQQGMSGAAAQNAYSSSKSTVVSAQQQPTVGVLQPSATQNLLPVGHSTLPQGSIHIQKSPNMSSAPQPQPVTYPPQQQLSLAHHLTSQPSGLLQSQTEYYQQQQPASMQAAASTGQSLPVSSLSAVSQGLSSVLTASGGVSVPGQGGEMTAAGGGTLPAAQMASSLLQPPAGGGMGGGGGGGGSLLVGGATLQQQTVGQYTIPGQPPTLSLHPTPSGVQNVPAVAVSSSVPTTVPTAVPSASSAAMPNMITSSLLADQQSQLARSHIGALGALGAQSLFAAGFGLMEAGSGRKSDGPALTQPPVDPGKDLMKPLIAESLQLSTPTVNSLFGIPITVDGDEDRNPSKAFYQAFQSGSRLRDSKAHIDSASGTGVVPIDNKIEQAMDLVKSHLMYAVREEVEVLKEQIKELYERNSELERENAVLKSLANSDQLSQLSNQPASASPPQPGPGPAQPPSHPQLQHLPNPQ